MDVEMKDFYDFSKAVRRPEFAESRRKYGYQTEETYKDFSVITVYAPDNGGVTERYILRPDNGERLNLPVTASA